MRGKVDSIRTEVLAYATRFFVDRGFDWLLPVVLSSVTDPLWPDPAEQKIEPLEVDVKTYGVKLRLTHSMILHKQVAVAKGIEKLFVLSPNVRIEARRPDGWHAFEFTQLDFEVADASMYDVMHLIVDLVCGLARHLDDAGLIDIHEKPFRFLKRGMFKSYDYFDIVDKFGSPEEFMRVHEKPFFITNIPREFYDYRDDMTGLWKNFDLYLPPYGEVASGGEREWEYDKIVSKIRESGLDVSNFEPYLRYARKGLLRPSAGAGIGVERLVTFFSGVRDIADVQVFRRIPYEPVEL